MKRPAPTAVLFVCSMNAVRSPMAEGLFRRRFGSRHYVESCGVRAGGEVDGLAVQVLDELGVDISRHRPRPIGDIEVGEFELVVTLAPEAHHRALEYTRTLPIEVEYWPCADPTVMEGAREQRLWEYRSVRDALDARIANRFAPPLKPQ